MAPTDGLLEGPVSLVCGHRVLARTKPDVLRGVLDYVSTGRGAWVLTLNLEMVSRGRLDRTYRDLVSQADVVLADGVPIVRQSRIKRGVARIPERVTGSDLTIELLRECPAERIAIIGGTEPELALKKAGIDASEVFVRTGQIAADTATADALAAEIRAHGARLVLIALGVPKQDRLASLLKERLPGAVLLGVGGSLDFIAGVKKRAPKLWQTLGMEWFYRLVTEPRRLAYRYLVLYWVGLFALVGDALGSWFRPRAA
jgi:N-acetylglucosaminyldiphosphoundecaprenol N-acetyl-beta-D-mannosaminyltransferase